MANEQNLKPIKTLSTEEAKKRGRNGGKRSGEVRRERKRLKEYMLLLLDLPVYDNKDFNKLSKMGVPLESIDNKMMLAAALFKKAVTQGDVAAVKEIRNIIGDDMPENGSGDLERLIAGLLDGQGI